MLVVHRWQSESRKRFAPRASARRITRRMLIACASLVSVTPLASCGGGGGAPAPTSPNATSILSLTVVAPSSTLHVGESSALTLSALDARGNAVSAAATSWSSATPSVASVDASGLVTALAPGRSTITAVAAGREAQLTINVIDVAVAQVVLSADSVQLAPGETHTLAALLRDAKGAEIVGRTIAWSSDRTATATVTSAGVVSAMGNGVALITASSGGVTATATVIVSGDPDQPLIVRVTPERATLVEGETLQLTASVIDVAGNIVVDSAVSWQATAAIGSEVATVSASGLVTALSPGTVIVEAAAGTARGATAIVVRRDVDESIVVTFARPTLNEAVGDTVSVYVSVKSSAPLDSVVATVARASRPLTATPVGALGNGVAWVGAIDLSDLQFGPYLLTVTAYDRAGGIGLAAITFVRKSRTGSGGSKPPPRNK